MTQEVADAAAQGDRSENAEYIYGKRRLREIDRRVRFLSKRLDEMIVVTEPPTDPERVFFGAWVTARGRGGRREDLPDRRRRRIGPRARLHQHRFAGGARLARQARGRRSHGARPQGRRRVHDRCRGVPLVSRRARSARRASPTPSPIRRRARSWSSCRSASRATPARQLRWRPNCEVTVLRDGGETYPAMLAAIAAAQDSICLETYILAADRTGDRFKAALLERARAGVAVRAHLRRRRLVRPAASLGRRAARRGLPGDRLQPDRAVASAVPAQSHRDHRKIIVVDNAVAFTGGLNIANDYAAVDDGGVGWHDMHCKVTGPIVLDLARMFRRTWMRAGGAALRAPAAGRRRRRPAMVRASCGCSTTRGAASARTIRRAYLHVIRTARESVLIENAYFLPDRGLRRALSRAVRRGVDVRIIVPGPLRRAADRVGEPLRAARAVKQRRQDPALARRDDAREDRGRGRDVVDDRQLQLRRAEPVQQPRGHGRDPRPADRHRADPDAVRARRRELRAVRHRSWRQLPWWKKALAWFGFPPAEVPLDTVVSLARAARGALWTVISSMGGRAVGVLGTLIMTRFLHPGSDRRGRRRDGPRDVGELDHDLGLRPVRGRAGPRRRRRRGHVARDGRSTCAGCGLARSRWRCSEASFTPLIDAPRAAHLRARDVPRALHPPARRDARTCPAAPAPVPGVGDVARHRRGLVHGGRRSSLAAYGMGGMAIVLAQHRAVDGHAARSSCVRPASGAGGRRRRCARRASRTCCATACRSASRASRARSRATGTGSRSRTTSARDAVGQYNLAYNLADVPAIQVGEQIALVLMPSMAELPPERRARALERSSALLSLIIFPLAVGLGLVAYPLDRHDPATGSGKASHRC